MRMLGIDPGLATIGIGIVDSTSPYDVRVVEWLVISTPPTMSFPLRLAEIHRDLTGIIESMKPDLCIVEKLYFAANARTAIDVAQARGVIILAIEQQNLPIVEPTPLQLKSGITGDGKADKRQMQEMIMRLLHLKEIPKPDDAADALALAVYGAITQERRKQEEK